MQDETGAVIAAAGTSSRMGSFKPLLKLGEMTFVERILASFRQASVSPVVLVTGHRAEDLKKHVAGAGTICVHNPDYAATEMIDSVRLGLRYLEGRCRRILVTPVDTPLFRADTVRKLMETPGRIVCPVWHGRRGHPILLDSSVLPELLDGDAAGGLAGIIGRLTGICEVSVEDEGTARDADTPADYEALLACHNRQLLRPEVSVSLRLEDTVLDPETAMLLRVIRYDGTVKEACGRLHISYRKAWNLIDRAEKSCRRQLVERSAGGESGGTSRLTAEGEKLLDAYERFTAHIADLARESFREYFPLED